MVLESKKRSASKGNKPVVYVLEGSPIPLARMRISKYAHLGGGRYVYDSQKELKLITSITIKSQHGDRPLYSGPLHMDMNFYFPVKKTRHDINEGDYHFYKPDLDNLVKMVLDICQFVIFKNDDSRVSEITCKKMYTYEHPRTEFTVYELKDK